MVEFKPALGWVFREYLKEYTHWAYGDLDVFFGDLTKGWLEPSEMREYDVITYRSVNDTPLHSICYAKLGCSSVPYICLWVLIRPGRHPVPTGVHWASGWRIVDTVSLSRINLALLVWRMNGMSSRLQHLLAPSSAAAADIAPLLAAFLSAASGTSTART